jgi:hypothetical protein
MSNKTTEKSLPQESKNPVPENSETKEVVERSPHYWVQLYGRCHNYALPEVLDGILNHDIKLYGEILDRLAYKAKVVRVVAFNAVEPTDWILSYNKTKKAVSVVRQDNANVILQDWFEFGGLPRTLPDGTVIGPVKTFDQLLAIMTQFNPYWLLEVVAYTLSGRDFGWMCPNSTYSYSATPEQILQIRAILTILQEVLEQAAAKK